MLDRKFINKPYSLNSMFSRFYLKEGILKYREFKLFSFYSIWRPGLEIIKTLFKLNSTEHEIHHAHKC